MTGHIEKIICPECEKFHSIERYTTDTPTLKDSKGNISWRVCPHCGHVGIELEIMTKAIPKNPLVDN